MKSMGVFEVKTHLSEILEQGKPVTITKRGEAIAEIVPVERMRNTERSAEEIFESFKTLRRQVKERFPKKDETSIREMIDEGRR